MPLIHPPQRQRRGGVPAVRCHLHRGCPARPSPRRLSDGLAVDQTYHPVSRSSLKLLRLWGRHRSTRPAGNGPVTTAADFGSAA